MSAAEFEFEIDDHKSLLRSSLPAPDPDPEAAQPGSAVARRNGAIGDLLRHLDRGLSGNRRSIRRPPDRAGSPLPLLDDRSHDALGDGAPPEWALLLIGCLLGLATGLCVAAFSRGVHVIHEWAWAGTPNEGAAWLRLQRLADTWHRILLIPVTGGVVVGMMHGLLEIFEQIKQSRSSRPSVDFLSAIFPTIKAIQAAVTLGTGCSLGPEGPSVDIGKSCAYGCSEMMENNRERRIALVAAGAAAGIASGRKFLRCKLDGCSRFIWMDNAMKEKEKLEACYPKEKHEACDPKEKLNANKGKLKITIEGTVNEGLMQQLLGASLQLRQY